MPTLSDRHRWLFLLGVVAVAVNLRPAIVSVAPLLEQIRADVVLSYTTVSLLTSVPTLLMGAAAFLAPWLARRAGRVPATGFAIAVVFLGLAVRVGAGHGAILLGSTLLVGIGIGTGQAYLPALIGEYYADRAAFATGLYSTGIIVGAGLASGITVPVRDLLGAWPLALAAWAVPAGLGVVLWAGFAAVAAEPAESPERPSPGVVDARQGLPWREGTAWLTVLFFAGQAAVFYSVATWLPSYYLANGLSVTRAGFVLSAVFAAMPVGSLALSHLAERLEPRRPPYLLGLAALLLGLVGIAFVPLSQPFVWAALLGIGLGGIFALALLLPVDHAPTHEATAQLTAMTFGVGYLVAALGPVALGVLLDAVGDFTVGWLVLAGVTAGLVGIALTFTPGRVASS